MRSSSISKTLLLWRKRQRRRRQQRSPAGSSSKGLKHLVYAAHALHSELCTLFKSLSVAFGRCGGTWGLFDKVLGRWSPYDGAPKASEQRSGHRHSSSRQRGVGGMFGALTSVLARECRSAVTGRMAGALFEGESNSLIAKVAHICCPRQSGLHLVWRSSRGDVRQQSGPAARTISSGWKAMSFFHTHTRVLLSSSTRFRCTLFRAHHHTRIQEHLALRLGAPPRRPEATPRTAATREAEGWG